MGHGVTPGLPILAAGSPAQSRSSKDNRSAPGGVEAGAGAVATTAREMGTGWGCPQRLPGGLPIIPVSDAEARAGRGGEGRGGKDPAHVPHPGGTQDQLALSSLLGWKQGGAELPPRQRFLSK